MTWTFFWDPADICIDCGIDLDQDRRWPHWWQTGLEVERCVCICCFKRIIQDAMTDEAEAEDLQAILDHVLDASRDIHPDPCLRCLTGE